jgi:hypothetical protein
VISATQASRIVVLPERIYSLESGLSLEQASIHEDIVDFSGRNSRLPVGERFLKNWAINKKSLVNDVSSGIADILNSVSVSTIIKHGI